MTTTKTTTTTSKDTRSFLTRHSTLWVTLVRLGLILLPTLVSSASWLYNPSFVSVLIRPHESLAQLEEARAIRALTSRTDFSGFYDANDSVRIPPLLLAVLTKILETTGSNVGFWLSLFLLVVDLLIAYRIEQIGTRLLDLAFSARPSDDGNSFTEEELQRRLPECVRPQFAHIFPIYGEGSSKEENDTKQQFYEPSISIKSLPLLSAQIYFWSPFTILPSSLLYCWQNIASLFLVSSLYESTHCSSKGSLSMASFFLAVATYLEPHHLAYVTPIILLSSVSSDSNRFVSFSVTGPWKWEKPAIFVIVTFALWLLLLQGVSCILVGPENYGRILGAVYGTTWLTTSPNLSLQWYFRMQIFSRFRDYFGAMYAGVPFMLIGPLCLRFFRYPGVLVSSIGCPLEIISREPMFFGLVSLFLLCIFH